MRLAQLKKSNKKGKANLVGMVDERLFPVRFLDLKVVSSALDLCGTTVSDHTSESNMDANQGFLWTHVRSGEPRDEIIVQHTVVILLFRPLQ